MNSADLKYRIEIWSMRMGTTDYGRTKPICEYKCSTRARVNYLTGNRTVEGDQTFYSVDREFIVRSYVPVAYNDIIKFDGDDWEVLSIDKNHEMNDIVVHTTRLIQHITPTGATGATGVANINSQK